MCSSSFFLHLLVAGFKVSQRNTPDLVQESREHVVITKSVCQHAEDVYIKQNCYYKVRIQTLGCILILLHNLSSIKLKLQI